MKNSTALDRHEDTISSVPLARLTFRKRVEAEIINLPQRLFGLKKNSVRIRLSNRFILLLLRNGLDLKSTALEIRAALEAVLAIPLTRLLSCGQLTFGDVLMIRTKNKTHEIQIERISRRSGTSLSKA